MDTDQVALLVRREPTGHGPRSLPNRDERLIPRYLEQLFGCLGICIVHDDDHNSTAPRIHWGWDSTIRGGGSSRRKGRPSLTFDRTYSNKFHLAFQAGNNGQLWSLKIDFPVRAYPELTADTEMLRQRLTAANKFAAGWLLRELKIMPRERSSFNLRRIIGNPELLSRIVNKLAEQTMTASEGINLLRFTQDVLLSDELRPEIFGANDKIEPARTSGDRLAAAMVASGLIEETRSGGRAVLVRPKSTVIAPPADRPRTEEEVGGASSSEALQQGAFALLTRIFDKAGEYKIAFEEVAEKTSKIAKLEADKAAIEAQIAELKRVRDTLQDELNDAPAGKTAYEQSQKVLEQMRRANLA